MITKWPTLPLIGLMILHITIQCQADSSADSDPVVTLTLGGQLRGRRTSWQNQAVDLFTGIRFANPPTGDRRFKKPEEYPTWTGEKTANTVGNMCLQNDLFGRLVGDEDCLFLHVTVPGRVSPGAGKPVMVWIYGGGFNAGASSGYIGAPLAVNGDIIVVSLNYRLGIMGFLSDGPGTGNFGLWDQLEALRWVHNNIAAFGGDPGQVTIFGESAGASSVSALTLSPHTDGLFQRAIQQSGTLFLHWSWYKSENLRYQLVQQIRESHKCNTPGNVYECFTGMSEANVFNSIPVLDPFNPPFGPTPDNDFFSADVEEEGYNKARRFDLMCGINGQEATLEMYAKLLGFAAMRNQTIDNGLSLDLAEQFLQSTCSSSYAPLSPGLCVEHIVGLYRLDRTRSDKERARRLSYFMSDILYDVGAIETLLDHSQGNRSTYAYYFTERYEPQSPFMDIPDWLRRSADHTQELPFLFDLVASDWLANILFNQTLTSSYRELSERMMTMWTNFAISGNPNGPAPLGRRSVAWPEFTSETESYLDIRNWWSRVIQTPNKERLDKLQNGLIESRNAQYIADKPPCNSHNH